MFIQDGAVSEAAALAGVEPLGAAAHPVMARAAAVNSETKVLERRMPKGYAYLVIEPSGQSVACR